VITGEPCPPHGLDSEQTEISRRDDDGDEGGGASPGVGDLSGALAMAVSIGPVSHGRPFFWSHLARARASLRRSSKGTDPDAP